MAKAHFDFWTSKSLVPIPFVFKVVILVFSKVL